LRVFNKNTFSYSPGIIAEIKISSPVYWLSYGYSWLLTLHYNYIMQTNNDKFFSNMHSFGLSIGFIGMRKVRDM
jgi:hypothetical protein